MKFGIGAEVVASIVEENFGDLKVAPSRLGIIDVPIPSTRALANSVYPGQKSIISAVADQLEIDLSPMIKTLPDIQDTPNKSFTGPF